MVYRAFASHPARAIIVAVSLLSAASMACSGDATASGKQTTAPVETSVTAPPAPRTDLHVELAEWSVTPNATRLAAGSLRISATNNGARPHDLVVIRVDDPRLTLPIKDDTVDETKVTIVDRFREFKSGEKEKSITLAPGEYLLICNLAGHYEQGMASAISVK